LPAVFFCLISKAQFYNLPNEYSSAIITEKVLSAKDSSIHCGVKPYIHFFSPKYANVNDTFRIFKYIVDDPALDIAFLKHTITIQPHKQNYKFTIDPILNVDIGNDYRNGKKRQTNTNGRGFIAAGYIGEKVYFESLFSENQSFFPSYVDSFARASQVVPGQGRTKPFKGNGYDYAFSSGFVSLQPYKTLNIQVGHGKHKIGNGYRSLLLSDNAFNYPYIRVTQQLLKGRVQYTNIYAVLMNLEPATKIPVPNAERLFQKKAASFQYISANPFKFLNIGLFQGMIWQAGDSKNRQHLDINYFDPVIFVNTAKYGLNNPNNILIGGDVKIKITNKINVYGQYMADNLSSTLTIGNGWGWQAGVNFYDVFKIKNLFFQVEYNSVSEGSYISPVTASTDQSWSHYNQSLAYTPGYGNELIVITNYKFRRLFLDLKYYHIDVPSSKDYYYTRQMVNGRIGFLINPSNNLTVHLGYVYRNQIFPNFKSYDNESTYIYLGVRTNISNFYYDF
jgi:hypothetical protein